MEEQEQKESLISKYQKKILKKAYMKNKGFLGLLIGVIVFNLILLLSIYLGIKTQENIIQTRFNSFYGVTSTGSWQDYYSIYFKGFMVLVINSVLAMYLYDKERILSYFLLVLALVSEIVLIFQVSNLIKLINL